MAINEQKLFNTDAIRSMMVEHLKKDMLDAVEPCLQEALKEIEVRMRTGMASFLIGRIESHFDMTQSGEILTIRVKQGK